MTASRKLEEIFSSSLGGDELESAIASIPKRLDKFEGKWDQLVEWAERKYGKGDRRISNVGPICEHDRIRARCRECWKLGIGGASSETNDVNHELGGISPLGTLLLLCSIVILFVPLTYENGNSVSLLDAKGICSDGITAAFSGSVCSNVNDAFLAVVAMGLLGVYLNYTSVNYPSAGRSAPRNVSPGGGVKSKYCSECGTQFSGSEKFCSNCGSAR